ncbi:MAG: hypothetical protein RI924_184 [Bacteroidota bacterium]|jgi:dihydrofolate synthase/folylpolyglutamate synthase
MPFSSYRDTLDYLYAQLPMFTRIGAVAYKKDLNNITALCEALGNPEKKFTSIHVGGTNGKGSTSHMLAAILQTAGYKTGLHTSPHLKDFRERIRINGNMVSEQSVIDFVNRNETLFKKIEPSFFEASVALAFEAFAEAEVDIAVIEVGLGGRLDSTNIISPLLSIITNIGFDHMNILGNTLSEIAGEKAGIIKVNTPVIIGESLPETQVIFEKKASEVQAPISFAQNDWTIIPLGKNNFMEMEAIERSSGKKMHLQLDLTGSYQLKNLPAVLVAVDELRKKGFSISDTHIKTALKQVKTLTGLQGRWQTLQTKPLVICDTGHNEDGIREVLQNISETPHQNLHLVWGMVQDKEIGKVLGMLPKSATYYFCQPAIPRAKAANELRSEATIFGLKGNVYPTVVQAYQTALNKAAAGDLIFIGGSTFVVAEVI